jgi:epsilon-lactone hydrolase
VPGDDLGWKQGSERLHLLTGQPTMRAVGSPELEAVTQSMFAAREAPPRPLEEARAGADGFSANFPPPDGILAEPADVGGVPGEWVTAPGSTDQRTIVYLHGGGYVMGSVASHRGAAARIAAASGARAFTVEYPLAPEHPYPAALDAVLAVWQGLLDDGIDASTVVFAGDSAGGGLAIAAAMRARDEGRRLPGALVLISPWVDLTCSGETMETNAATDPLINAALRERTDQYAPGFDPKEPYLSPLFGDHADLPATLIQVAATECLLDDGRRLAEAMSAAGVDATLEVWPDALHAWHIFAPVIPEAMAAIDAVGAFVRARV